MRDIKFRVWDSFCESMECWDDIRADNHFGYKFLGKPDEDYIFQQYTGLKDKNNNEIFEGDICYNNNVNKYCYVKYISHEFCFIPAGKETTSYGIGSLPYMEVVGNIYENQELLRS